MDSKDKDLFMLLKATLQYSTGRVEVMLSGDDYFVDGHQRASPLLAHIVAVKTPFVLNS